jgi:hypothetical protein
VFNEETGVGNVGGEGFGCGMKVLGRAETVGLKCPWVAASGQHGLQHPPPRPAKPLTELPPPPKIS